VSQLNLCLNGRGERFCTLPKGHPGLHQHHCNQKREMWDGGFRAWALEKDKSPGDPLRPCICCLSCKGSGHTLADAFVICPDCQGTGERR
jgi:hypothetical protein